MPSGGESILRIFMSREFEFYQLAKGLEGRADEYPAIENYDLIEILGEGSFGVVYLAEERDTERLVAVKVLKSQFAESSAIGRFEEEQEILSKLNDPGIARIYDAGKTGDGLPFISMEIIEGDLITRFCEREKCSLEVRLKVFVRVCRAVMHAHIHGVIHRDLKPSNILAFHASGEKIAVKVIDFGIAKNLDPGKRKQPHSTRFDSVVGTPSYMSPEQARSAQTIDSRTDVFSLGCILFELLTGRPPISPDAVEGIPPHEAIKLVCDQEIPVLKRRNLLPSLRESYSPELEWILAKILQPAREQRYQNLQEVIFDLESHLGNRPISAGPVTKSYYFKKFLRRNKRTCSFVATLFVVIMCGLVTSFFFYRTAEDSRELEAKAHDETRKARVDLLKSYSLSDHRLAMNRFHEGDFSMAIAHWCRALRTDPGNQQAKTMMYSALDFDRFPRPVSEGRESKHPILESELSLTGNVSVDLVGEDEGFQLFLSWWPDGDQTKIEGGKFRPSFALSPDGRYLALVGDEESRLLDLSNESSSLEFSREGSLVDLFFPSEEQLVLVSENGVERYQIQSGAITLQNRSECERVEAISYSKRKEHALIAHEGGKLSLFSRSTERLVPIELSQPFEARSIQVSKSGKECLLVSGDRAMVLEIPSGNLLGSWSSPVGRIDHALLGEGNAKTLLAVGEDLYFWEARNKKSRPLKQATISLPNPVKQMIQVGASSVIISLVSGELMCFDRLTGELRNLLGKQAPVDVVAAGASFLVREKIPPRSRNTLWRALKPGDGFGKKRFVRGGIRAPGMKWLGEHLFVWKGSRLVVFEAGAPSVVVGELSCESGIHSIDFDGKRGLVYLANGEIVSFDSRFERVQGEEISVADDQVRVEFLSHQAIKLWRGYEAIEVNTTMSVSRLYAVSPDQSHCAFVVREREILLIETKTGAQRILKKNLPGPVTGLHFANSNTLLTSLIGGEICRFLLSGNEIEKVQYSAGRIDVSSLSVNREIFATVSKGSFLQLWRSNDLSPISVPVFLSQPIAGIAFSSDGRSFAILDQFNRIETHRLLQESDELPDSFLDFLEKLYGLRMDHEGNLIRTNPVFPPLPNDSDATRLVDSLLRE